MIQVYDYVIIGSGFGGSVSAMCAHGILQISILKGMMVLHGAGVGGSLGSTPHPRL